MPALYRRPCLQSDRPFRNIRLPGKMTLIPSSDNLPLSTSASLALVHPTEAERRATWLLNSQSWRGAISVPAYLRREEFLGNQPLTCNGSLSFWVLVDSSTPPSNPRRILASCETIRKRALIAEPGRRVEEVMSHGIGSVFCDPQFRGRGYAGRMMMELGQILDTSRREAEMTNYFTVLFSDIGKKFYAKCGWRPCCSSHIELSPLSVDKYNSTYGHFPATEALYADDLAELCDVDETLLKSSMEKRSSHSSKTQVAFIPDLQTHLWQHAREEFASKELLNRLPDTKGAIATTRQGKRVWCTWTRIFGDTEAANILYILRMVIEGEISSNNDDAVANVQTAIQNKSRKELVLATASILNMARQEATKWKMQSVRMWNPSPLTLLAAQELEPSAQLIDREEESIASLRWYKDTLKAGDDVDWIANEKFSWC